MSEKQNIFYTSISKFYSEIFPYNPKQLSFVNGELGSFAGKQILDIGCATGQLAFQLAAHGAEVTGIDLNEDLLVQAQKNIPQPNLKFQPGNMLELENDFQAGQFDAILCFGNTLVHLQALKEMRKMIFSVYRLLKEGGHFLLQILNYDHIIAERINDLPFIETEAVRFVRKYEFEENNRLVNFKTELFIKSENKLISNETTLFALESKELQHLLQSEGFKSVKLYSNFDSGPFGGKHLPLVLSCRK